MARARRTNLYGSRHVRATNRLKWLLRVNGFACYCSHCGLTTARDRSMLWALAPEDQERGSVERHHLIDHWLSPGILVCRDCHINYFHSQKRWRKGRNHLGLIFRALLKQWVHILLLQIGRLFTGSRGIYEEWTSKLTTVELDSLKSRRKPKPKLRGHKR